MHTLQGPMSLVRLCSWVRTVSAAPLIEFLQQLMFPQGEWFYPQADPNNRENVPVDAASITLSLNGQGDTPLQVTLPSYVISARVYFAASGSLTFLTNGASGIAALVQPSVTNQMDSNYNTNWGFAEFTNTAGGLYINPSQVRRAVHTCLF